MDQLVFSPLVIHADWIGVLCTQGSCKLTPGTMGGHMIWVDQYKYHTLISPEPHPQTTGRMRACSVAQLCLTLCDFMDWGLPGSSVRGIFQASILEWVALSSSTGSFSPRDWTHVSCIGWRILYNWATWKVNRVTRLKPARASPELRAWCFWKRGITKLVGCQPRVPWATMMKSRPPRETDEVLTQGGSF